MENAAPLCKNCHTMFGNDPNRRTEIIHRRDVWYETVERMYQPVSVKEYEEIKEGLILIKHGQDEGFSKLQSVLVARVRTFVSTMTSDTAENIAAEIMSATAPTSIFSIPTCPSCRQPYMFCVDNKCPNCGADLQSE